MSGDSVSMNSKLDKLHHRTDSVRDFIVTLVVRTQLLLLSSMDEWPVPVLGPAVVA